MADFAAGACSRTVVDVGAWRPPGTEACKRLSANEPGLESSMEQGRQKAFWVSKPEHACLGFPIIFAHSEADALDWQALFDERYLKYTVVSSLSELDILIWRGISIWLGGLPVGAKLICPASFGGSKVADLAVPDGRVSGTHAETYTKWRLMPLDLMEKEWGLLVRIRRKEKEEVIEISAVWFVLPVEFQLFKVVGLN
ncbi:hypothetical protein N7517_004610 [Penicillium concentricum]|uniref:Uncharacterized protein n=1 Tax=Penicillium concentricum TaxID=293559 RepID=A0A9W9S8J3_9EURO|nr:uncharacterized protein N7517_004610 [Penicillium concentricum]KAJ5372604.1 hypothetical protein N7517_004610 [Penicillium concentricum]